MAQYRFAAQVIKRADGRSAVAAAAYRAGERLTDERLEMPFDYRRRGGVEHAEIMLSEGAPAAFSDRATLWNAVEAAEKRVDARVSREVQLSLPHELDADQRLALVRDFVQSAFVDKGMIADVAIHSPDAHGDDRNHHAHIMLTTRHVDGDRLRGEGFGGKAREWDKREQLAEWRAEWAAVQNRHLVAALGPDAPKVSHQSLEDQGIDRAAMIHLGPTASAIERKGERSDRGEVNRDIAAENAERLALPKELAATLDRAAIVALQTTSSPAMLIKELADYKQSVANQATNWRAERAVIVVPDPLRVSTVRQEILGPARASLRAAEAHAERTTRRTKAIAEKRTTLASFIRNPQRAIWAKIKEVHAIDAARREVARSRAAVKVREDWLRSDPGRAYVSHRVEQSRRAIEPIKTQARTLDRKLRRVDNRIGSFDKVIERVKIAEQLGVKSVARPIRVSSGTQLVRNVDRTLASIFASVPAQQLQQARSQVQALARGMGMSR